MEPILKIRKISKSFVRNIRNKRGEEAEERFNILNNINLEIHKGLITALIGGNGAGKTTLFNIISGFIKPNGGEILYNGKYNLIKLQPYIITNIGIGRLFQDNHIFPKMTVLENMLIADDDKFGEFPFVKIFKKDKVKSKEEERINKAYNIFNKLFGENNPFWQMKDDFAENLSYGQQRLLGLARLLMGNYQLVLLDEPTAGVNPSIIKKTADVIKFMVKEKKITVLLIEHNMKFVEDIADYCCFLSHGKITAMGTPQDVIGNPVVKRKYLGL